MLKRQYSLDRGDDPGDGQKQQNNRMHKQNSAGAAHDLEMIEEVPLVSTQAPTPYHHRKSETVSYTCETSVPVDTLSLH